MRLGKNVRHLVDVLARRERGRLIAGLLKRLGNHRVELAEDVAQEALLAALSIWPYRGIPDNPAAWLSRVAGNRAIDRLRKLNRETPYDVEQDERGVDSATTLYETRVADPELRLMFLACHPMLDGIDRLALTLRIVSGFTAREIADVFLVSEAAMAQRLARSKRKLRGAQAQLTDAPTVFEIEDRLGAVLKVVYLMFSIGYAPRRGSQLIRRDVALEAVRLAQELADEKLTGKSATKALAALLCFQASRLDAREDDRGRPVLLREQNRAHWDTSMIRHGVIYLTEAMDGEITRYHLEAGIASIYATAASWDEIDWAAIVGFYDRLEQTTDSPVVTVNACVARAFAGEPETSLDRLDSLLEQPGLTGYAPYHIARAEILLLVDRRQQAADAYREAIRCGAPAPVIEHLEYRLGAALLA